MSDTPKNKGGRPTKAEEAARGITRTELDGVLRVLKRHFGPSVSRAIEISSNEDLPLDKQFRMNVELAKLYVEFLKVDKSFKAAAKAGDGEEEQAPQDMAPVFQLVPSQK